MNNTPYHPNQRLEAARREIADIHKELGVGYYEDKQFNWSGQYSVFTCKICGHTNTKRCKINQHLRKRHKYIPLHS